MSIDSVREPSIKKYRVTLIAADGTTTLMSSSDLWLGVQIGCSLCSLWSSVGQMDEESDLVLEAFKAILHILIFV